jgi:hypothetical protein
MQTHIVFMIWKLKSRYFGGDCAVDHMRYELF